MREIEQMQKLQQEKFLFEWIKLVVESGGRAFKKEALKLSISGLAKN